MYVAYVKFVKNFNNKKSEKFYSGVRIMAAKWLGIFWLAMA